MKKRLWLIIPFFLISSTISFAQNQDTPSTTLLTEDLNKAQYYCSVSEKSFEKYINLIGLSKEKVLSVYISTEDTPSSTNEQESTITTFDNEIDGVYFGNLKYESSAPLKDTKLEEGINKVYNRD